MIITKANAKDNLGEFICFSITKANAKTNLQIFFCNCFRADGMSIGPNLAQPSCKYGNVHISGRVGGRGSQAKGPNSNCPTEPPQACSRCGGVTFPDFRLDTAFSWGSVSAFRVATQLT